MSINRLTISGYVFDAPDVRRKDNGDHVVEVRLLHVEGEKSVVVRCVAFGAMADAIAEVGVDLGEAVVEGAIRFGKNGAWVRIERMVPDPLEKAQGVLEEVGGR